MMLVLVCSVAALLYVYVGYPPLLRLLVAIRGPRRVRRADITPRVSLVISAYNEAAVIARKLDNALSLIYPKDALQIVVISDASDDGTDEIVASYAAQGVILARQTERRGKTVGLNRTVPTLDGEIVVFSDANAMYEPDALLKLVRNFADPEVGCVTGEARYLRDKKGPADAGERLYWDYEIQIKRLETALGSMVGGDGAIYAIRRSLWRELPPDAINDFLNPLQIVAAGWRAVYEPEAICYEETAGRIGSEYRRRVRIVSRSWRAVFQAPGVLNPLRVGLFTWSIVSHKILRWLSALFAALALLAGIASVVRVVQEEPRLTLGIAVAVGALLTITARGRRLVAMLAYFSAIYAASFIGVVKGSLGKVSGVWTTPRQPDAALRPVGPQVAVGVLLQIAAAATAITVILLARSRSTEQLAAIIFWSSAAVLAYIYMGYPAVLTLLRHRAKRAVRQGAIEPRVCVFIPANDECTVIEAKILNTLALDYPADRLEVIVASDGSVDGTNEIVRRFAPRVRLVEFFPRRGKIATINDGIAAVSSEIVVFSDANTFLQRDAVRALVRNFADPQVGGVSGDVVLVGERAALGPSEDLYYRYERWIQRVESEIGSMIGADGALYAIRRELFVPAPPDTILDDMAIPMAVIQKGRRVVFEGAARAFEQGSDTAKEEFARKMRVIAGAMQFIRRPQSTVPLAASQVIFSLISHKALRWFSPLFAACAFGSSLALANAGPAYAAAVVAQSGVLLLALAGCVRPMRRIGAVAIAHYFCLLQAAAGIGFLRGISGSQSVKWRRFQRSPVEIARA